MANWIAGHTTRFHGNSRIWYEAVFAFLAEHVLGEPWHRPSLL